MQMLSLGLAALGVAVRLPWQAPIAPMPAAVSRAAARMTTTVRDASDVAGGQMRPKPSIEWAQLRALAGHEHSEADIVVICPLQMGAQAAPGVHT